jgi:tetratricopeptide (TPR) repeat protein
LQFSQVLAEHFPHNTDYLHTLATAWQFMGDVLSERGLLNEAINAYHRNYEIEESLSNKHPFHIEFKRAWSNACARLGLSFSKVNQGEKSRDYYRQYLTLSRSLSEDHKYNAAIRYDLVFSLDKYASICIQDGEYHQAFNCYDEMCQITTQLLSEAPDYGDYKKLLSSAHLKRGQLYVQTGRNSKAHKEYERALEIVKKLTVQIPENAEYKIHLANLCNYFAELLINEQQYVKATIILQEAEEVLLPLISTNSQTTDLIYEYAIVILKKSDISVATRNFPEAVQYLTVFYDTTESLCKFFPEQPEYLNALIIACERLFYINYELADDTQSYYWAEKGVNHAQKLFELSEVDAGYRNALALAYQKRGIILMRQKSYSSALNDLTIFYEAEKMLLEDYPGEMQYQMNTGVALKDIGDAYAALADYEHALVMFEEMEKFFLRLRSQHPDSISMAIHIVTAAERKASALMSMQYYERALSGYKNMHLHTVRFLEQYTGNANLHHFQAIAYRHIGKIYDIFEQYDLAIFQYNAMAKITQRLHELYPDNDLFHNSLAVAYYEIAALLSRYGKSNDIFNNYFSKSFDLWLTLCQKFPHHPLYAQNLAEVRNALPPTPPDD